MEKRIIMKVSELSAKLGPIVDGIKGLNTSVLALGTNVGAISAQLAKAKDEILAELEDVEIPEEAAAKIEALGTLAEQASTAASDAAAVVDQAKITAQALDDLNPDKTNPPATPAGS